VSVVVFGDLYLSGLSLKGITVMNSDGQLVLGVATFPGGVTLGRKGGGRREKVEALLRGLEIRSTR